MYPAADGRRAAPLLPRLHDDAPDEVCSGLAFITAPPEDFVPEPVRGQPVIGVVCLYAGPIEDAEEAFRPLREFGPPGIDMTGRCRTPLQTLLDANPPGCTTTGPPDFLAELPDEAIDTLSSSTRPSRCPR